MAGDFNTGFIAEHYRARASRAEDVPHDDPMFLVALAAFVHRKRAASARPASAGSCRATACKIGRDFVVVVLGAGGAAPSTMPVRVDEFDAGSGKADVVVGERHFAIQSD